MSGVRRGATRNFGTDADLAVWLAEHELPAQCLDGSLAALHVLRQHARAATEALATGRTPTAADLDALNAALGAPPGRRRKTEVRR